MRANPAVNHRHLISGAQRQIQDDTATGIAFAATKNRLTQDFNAVTELSNIVFGAIGAP